MYNHGMANTEDVRKYLAYWFQLGKRVVIGHEATSLLPQPVYRSDRYSQEFEECWQKTISSESGDCYLEGTHETIAELLTSAWEILPCSRCNMPVPMRNVGMPAESCPCNDLPGWPNTDLPAPRSAIDNQDRLIGIRDRLLENLSTKTK
ncbi:hypothetical protein Nos7107_2033 [Nostoc sp. PCC 7107]|nr:hypothetical protein Nos7107_2033 [Nostoc sp. PCC 7107]